MERSRWILRLYGAYFLLLQDSGHTFRAKTQREALSQWLDQYMSPIHVELWLERLTSKENGNSALNILLNESENWDSGYPYLPAFVPLLEHPDSRVRNRALELIAANAKWDSQSLYDSFIHQFLLHIQDKTPAMARKCVQPLPKIAIAKPELVPQIRNTLQEIDLSLHSERAQQSVKNAVSTALAAINLIK